MFAYISFLDVCEFIVDLATEDLMSGLVICKLYKCVRNPFEAVEPVPIKS